MRTRLRAAQRFLHGIIGAPPAVVSYVVQEDPDGLGYFLVPKNMGPQAVLSVAPNGEGMVNVHVNTQVLTAMAPSKVWREIERAAMAERR